jgi:hypothetical protein
MLDDVTARGLALVISFEWSADDERLLAPLVDATLVWADDEDLERIAVPLVATLWDSELRGDIEAALDRLAPRHEHVRAALDAARADLAAGPQGSRLARAVVEQAAVELTGELMLPEHCLLCAEEFAASDSSGDLRRHALRLARIAGRAVDISDAEIRRASATAAVSTDSTVAVALATDARRLAVRAWLRNLAELGSESLPVLSDALRDLVSEPLPAAADDEIWHETVLGLSERLEPALN